MLKDKLLKDFHGYSPIVDETVQSLPKVSEEAKRFFSKYITDTQYVMISVVGGGCSGFQYSFFIGDLPAENCVTLCEQPTVVVDKESLYYIKGASIEFEQSNFSEKITINNPRAVQSCGCGESFSIKETEDEAI